jgi:hypothetical protein
MRLSKEPHPLVVAGVAQGGIISRVPFGLFVKNMHSLSRQYELAFYADDTAYRSTSCHLALLFKNLESEISDLERLLID